MVKEEATATENGSTSSAELRIQLMPFDIDYDGEAKVSEYFESTVRQVNADGKVALRSEAEDVNEDVTLNASFRGRLLNGRTMRLPEKYQVSTLVAHG